MYRILLFILLPLFTFGQTFTGKIIDNSSNKPISYANIGVLSKNVGTVSSENGTFSLNLPSKVKDNDTLRISMIGYETLEYKVSKFKQICEQKGALGLNPTDYKLNEVVVFPGTYKSMRVGNTKRLDNMNITFSENVLGNEMAVLIKIKNRPTLIDKVYINIIECSYDSIFYRLNIYEYDKKAKTPSRNVLPKPVYMSYSKEDTEETLEIDLAGLNVYVEGNFVIGVEQVKDLGEGVIHFSANFMGSKGLARETSQAGWIKVPVNFGASISADIRQEEKRKK